MEKMVVVNKIEVFSLGKIVGLIYALFGLIIGAFMTLFSIMGSLVAQSFGASGAVGMLFGLGSIILLPIFYGVMGFIIGALAAFFYNLIAGWIGGLEVKVDVK